MLYLYRKKEKQTINMKEIKSGRMRVENDNFSFSS